MPEQWQIVAAARMTRTLARKPRKAKTRAYLATLPKRPPIVVSPDDYPRMVTRADARVDIALQMIRDAQRYADWERRGKPPSPSLGRKDRMRPRAVRQTDPQRVRLYEAQCGNCGLCGEPIASVADGTFDHVVPRALGGKNLGNLLLAHASCNNAKADRPPTHEELQTLLFVNERLSSSATPPGREPDGEAMRPKGDPHVN